MKSNIILLTSTLLLSSTAVLAEDAKTAESPYKASVEFGALLKTGDTASRDLKAGFDLEYKSGRWLSLLNADVLIREEEEEDDYETSDQKWNLNSQTNYTLEEGGKNYLFVNASYEDDRFSSFDNQSSITAGWGRNWYETETSSLFIDVGPGYKRDEIKATDTTEAETQSSMIGQTQLLYKHLLNDNVEFKQYFVAKYALESDANSVYKSETSITTKLIETLQLKVSYKIDHNTDVAADKENTNTQTSITLVYSF